MFDFGFVLLSKSLCRLLLKVLIATKGKESRSSGAAKRLWENQLGFLSPSAFPGFSWTPDPTRFGELGKLCEEFRAHCPRDRAQSFLFYCSNDTLESEGNLGSPATTMSAWVSFADSKLMSFVFVFVFHLLSHCFPKKRAKRSWSSKRSWGAPFFGDPPLNNLHFISHSFISAPGIYVI